MAISLTMTGTAEVLSKLRGMGERAPDLMEAALYAGATVIQEAAKQNCPKAAGTLAASIAIVTVNKSAMAVNLAIGPQVNYGVYPEFGTGIYAENGQGRQTPWCYRDAAGEFHWTRGMKPQPFMRPAFDANKAEAQRVFGLAITKLVSQP